LVCSFHSKVKILATRKKWSQGLGDAGLAENSTGRAWCYSESERSGTVIFKRAKEELLRSWNQNWLNLKFGRGGAAHGRRFGVLGETRDRGSTACLGCY
jgi:hypothetical protein